MGAAAIKTNQNATEVIQVFEYTSSAASHTSHGIFCYPDTHLNHIFQPNGQNHNLSAAAANTDAGFHQVGDQLRRRLVDGVAHGIDNDVDGGRHRFAQLDAADFHRLRQPIDQVATAHSHGALFGQGKGRADADLNALRHPLSDEQIIFVARILDDVFIHLITGHTNGAADDNAAHSKDGYFCSAAADINDHAAA